MYCYSAKFGKNNLWEKKKKKKKLFETEEFHEDLSP